MHSDDNIKLKVFNYLMIKILKIHFFKKIIRIKLIINNQLFVKKNQLI